MYEINKNNLILILLIFFLIGNFGSFFQAQFIYDSMHWGLVAQSAIDLTKDNMLPYKDFFIHYGFLSTLTQSVVLSIFEKNVIYLLYTSSFFFTLGNFIICLTAKKYLNLSNILLICLFIFLLHPFANHPWYNYQFYFLLVLSLFFLSDRSNLGIFLFGFVLSLASLVYENFLYLSVIILFLQIFLNKFYKNKKILFCIFGFILPLVCFHLYLSTFSLHKFWIKTFMLNSTFFEIYDTNLINLSIKYFKILLSKNIFTQTYFYIFLIILLLNFLIIINFLIKKIKRINFSDKENDIFLISIISLLLFFSTIHNPTIFRFSTGPVVGIISIFYFLEKFKIKHVKLVSYLILLQLFCNIAIPIKTENNKFFPRFSELEDNKINQNINYFISQKWSPRTWSTINFFDQNIMLIEEQCKNVKEFVNYTNDVFIYMIANKYFKSNQYLYFIKNERYHEILLRHYDVDIKSLIKNKLTNDSLIILIDIRDIFYFKNNYDLKNYKLIEAPYSFDHKRKGILIPQSCLKNSN